MQKFHEIYCEVEPMHSEANGTDPDVVTAQA